MAEYYQVVILTGHHYLRKSTLQKKSGEVLKMGSVQTNLHPSVITLRHVCQIAKLTGFVILETYCKKNPKSSKIHSGFVMDSILGSYSIFLKRKGLANRTIDQHRRRLTILLSNCRPWSEETFNSFIATKLETLSASAINKYCQTAKHYCELANINFSEGTFKRIAEDPKGRVTFSDDEIEAFLSLPPAANESEKVHQKWKVFWSLLAFEGSRPGEILKLTSSCVDIAAGALIFPKTKTGTGRTVKISPVIMDLVANYVKNLESKYLFCSAFDNSKPMSENAYLTDFRQRLERLGIKKPVVPYSFRHSLATRLLENDALLFTVQDILGHSSPNTTRIYYHGSLKSQEKAIKHDPIVKKTSSGREILNEIINRIHKDKECYADKLSFTITENSFSVQLNISLK